VSELPYSPRYGVCMTLHEACQPQKKGAVLAPSTPDISLFLKYYSIISDGYLLQQKTVEALSTSPDRSL
jgi:hypothetical protein